MNKNKVISILSMVFGAAITITALVFYIKSFGHDNYGEYGAEFWANTDYLLFMFDGIAFIAYGAYVLYEDLKKKANAGMVTEGAAFANAFAGFITTTYAFGKFFRALAKGNGFTAWYFVWGIVGLLVFVSGIVLHVILGKKNK